MEENSLIEELKMTPQERYNKEQKEFDERVAEYIDTKAELIIIDGKILTAKDKQHASHFKTEKKTLNKRLKRLRKLVLSELDDIARAKLNLKEGGNTHGNTNTEESR